MTHRNTRVAVGLSALLALALTIAGIVVVGSTGRPQSGTRSSATTSSATPTSAAAPLVAFYGDSYTRGAEASSPDKRWSTIVCRDQGWREFNPSHDGLGFICRSSVQLRGFSFGLGHA